MITMMGAGRWGAVLGLVVMAACGDGIQPGAPIDAPPTGEVRTRIDPASAADCAFGGSVVSSGIDDNRDTILDDGEIRTRTVLCNAEPPAVPGPDAVLVRLAVEPAGARCPEGGTAVGSGTDRNGDGKLEDDEVTATQYVCGESLLSRLVVEPAGLHCTAGGVAFLVGRDRDHDGTLADAEVEQFQYACGDVLSRDVVIGSAADAEALAAIVVLNGSLTISGASVTDLALPRLQHLFGTLLVQDAPQLTQLSAPALLDVTSDVLIRNNAQLARLALPELTRISGQLELSTNAALVDLSGLATLTRVGGDVVIHGNLALASIASPLRHIGAGLDVQDNPALTELSLTLADQVERLVIANNGLTSIHVVMVGDTAAPTLGQVLIDDSPALTTITLEAARLGSLFIAGDPKLSDLTVQVAEVDRDVTVRPSARLRHVAFLAGTGRAPAVRFHGSLDLWSPIETLETGTLPMLVEGICSITETQLTDLHAIGSARILLVGGNPKLTALAGIHVGALEVNTNAALATIVLDQSMLSGPVTIVNNAALHDVLFASLGRMDASMDIRDNPALTRVAAPTLTELAFQLSVSNNAALTEIAMPRLQRLGAQLFVQSCPALTSLTFPALTSARVIGVVGNAALHVLAFDALSQISTIDVSRNPVLPACKVEALFARLPGDHHQSGNDDTAMCLAPQD